MKSERPAVSPQTTRTQGRAIHPGLLKRSQPHAAGIDCGATSHYVAVPEDRDPEPVREFRTSTGGLHALADWLLKCGIKTVAMESTGVYWIPVHEALGGARAGGGAGQCSSRAQRARAQDRCQRLPMAAGTS